ncbi:RNA-binding S4 domain-containing protein [Butyricimonas sp. RTP31003st1_G1_RTP31003_210430]|uniref:RNA-binding S4 domain-containing protein n=1 Tax=Butyricimonas sp. RTP31003st1_G1_RTP31003_210430 TaxID=3143210 RepID=UPI0034A15A7E
MEKVRIDKWLWAVRIFKTRSLAAEECGKGHVSIGDAHVKASREVKVGDVVKVRVPPIEREYVVKQITDKRMSAQLAVDFVKEITSQEKLDILRGTFMQFESRDRGTGRPTKRDRRLIDKLKEL